jgi:predicted cupin superfamily sugar epimerase
MTAGEIISMLRLEAHPEGGYFTETYRSGESVARAHLPSRYGGNRPFGTAIYYLLTPDSFSSMHRLSSDEIFHFYLGDPVELLELHPDGRGEIILLGSGLAKGMAPQAVVPAGVWQGARLVPGGTYALLGTTVAPGFDFGDFEIGVRAALIERHSSSAELITALTRE